MLAASLTASHHSSYYPAYILTGHFRQGQLHVSSSRVLRAPSSVSPWDLEEGFDWVHLRERGIPFGQLDGCDAQRPDIAAGIVRIVVLLLTSDDL